MLTIKFKSNLERLIDIANEIEGIKGFHIIIIKDNENWKKKIKDYIHEDNSLHAKKYYSMTCMGLHNDICVESDFIGCIDIQINNMLEKIDDHESMIITISNKNSSYNRINKTIEKLKYVYIVAQN